jgi:hypothetical protein
MNAMTAIAGCNDEDGGGDRLEIIDGMIDMILAGRYHPVPEGRCPISRKIKAMAVWPTRA